SRWWPSGCCSPCASRRAGARSPAPTRSAGSGLKLRPGGTAESARTRARLPSAGKRLRQRLVVGPRTLVLHPVPGLGDEPQPAKPGRLRQLGLDPVLQAAIKDVLLAPDAEHRATDVGQGASQDVGERDPA